MPEFHAGKAPRNKAQRYPADPPTVEEIVAVTRQAHRARYGHRLTGLIVVLWRAGLRINEALSLTETELDERRGSIGAGRSWTAWMISVLSMPRR
jgi:integrase